MADRNNGREKGGRDEPPCAPCDCFVHRLTGPRLGRLAHRLGPGQPGGEVSGERGQLGAGPRGERLARPQVQLLFGQPALRESGRERVDDLLAVGVGGPEAAGRLRR